MMCSYVQVRHVGRGVTGTDPRVCRTSCYPDAEAAAARNLPSTRAAALLPTASSRA